MSDVYWQPGMKIDDVEKQIIKAAMKFYRDNKTATATSLGIAVRTLDNKLAIYKEQDDELQRRTEKIKLNQDASFQRIKSQNLKSTSQPSSQAPAEQPLPLQQRKEIQEVPQTSPPRISPNQNGNRSR